MCLLQAAIWELAAVGCLTTAEEDADITPLGQIAIAAASGSPSQVVFLTRFGLPTAGRVVESEAALTTDWKGLPLILRLCPVIFAFAGCFSLDAFSDVW